MGAADRNGFLGTWPNGLEIELTVAGIDEDGYVDGLYCNLRKTGIWFADLRRTSSPSPTAESNSRTRAASEANRRGHRCARCAAATASCSREH